MSVYSLPTSIELGGREYDIRTDFRDILEILQATEDPDLDDWEKQEVMYEILYVDCETIPPALFREACEKAVEFIDGNLPESKPKPKMMDWQQDAAIIIPAVNKAAGTEIRALKYLHWWTFLGYFMEIDGDGLFSQVLNIRQKKSKGKKLEKWEREFERNNKELVQLRKIRSAEEQKQVESIMKWL